MKRITANPVNSSKGNYKVTVEIDGEEKGVFYTNDSELYDDIKEMRDGFESELLTCDSFEELENYCIDRI